MDMSSSRNYAQGKEYPLWVLVTFSSCFRALSRNTTLDHASMHLVEAKSPSPMKKARSI